MPGLYRLDIYRLYIQKRRFTGEKNLCSVCNGPLISFSAPLCDHVLCWWICNWVCWHKRCVVVSVNVCIHVCSDVLMVLLCNKSIPAPCCANLMCTTAYEWPSETPPVVCLTPWCTAGWISTAKGTEKFTWGGGPKTSQKGLTLFNARGPSIH